MCLFHYQEKSMASICIYNEPQSHSSLKGRMMLTTCPNCQHVFNHHKSTAIQNQPSTTTVTTSMCGGRAIQCSVTLSDQLTSGHQRGHSGGGLVQPDVTVMLATSQPCQLTLGLPYPAVAINRVGVNDQLSPTSAVPSPSLPFTFIIPPVSSWNTQPMETDDTSDFHSIEHSVAALRQSMWYHENISWVQAATLLKRTPVGTFLIRDSSDSHFLFSLSVQTDRGPTSVRVHYVNGKFRLDAEERVAHLMPYFKSVIDLVAFYVKQGQSKKPVLSTNGSANPVWVDGVGKMYSPVTLTKPLLKSVPSLKHISRKVISANPSTIESKILPSSIKNYLAEYPYDL